MSLRQGAARSRLVSRATLAGTVRVNRATQIGRERVIKTGAIADKKWHSVAFGRRQREIANDYRF